MNLVERLRDGVIHNEESRMFRYDDDIDEANTNKRMKKAADEIERLEEEVNQWKRLHKSLIEGGATVRSTRGFQNYRIRWRAGHEFTVTGIQFDLRDIKGNEITGIPASEVAVQGPNEAMASATNERYIREAAEAAIKQETS